MDANVRANAQANGKIGSGAIEDEGVVGKGEGRIDIRADCRGRGPGNGLLFTGLHDLASQRVLGFLEGVGMRR
ncbi:hypothetical protein ABTE18_20595, partial [Acinetobacter baumannii]